MRNFVFIKPYRLRHSIQPAAMISELPKATNLYFRSFSTWPSTTLNVQKKQKQMATNNKSAFAINMIRARNERGWTQQEAALKIGIKRSLLGAYEEDRAKPPIYKLCAIAKTYKITDWPQFIHSTDYFVEYK